MANTVMLKVPDGEMALFDVEPQGDAKGAVVVFQEAFGVNEHIQDICRRLAAEGYRAVAPHLFHRTGDPVLDYSNIEKVMPHIQAMSEKGLLDDLDATLAHLSGAGFSGTAIGTVGFCMGGTVSFLAAVRHALGASVTFYGGGIREGRFGMKPQLELAKELKTPWLGLYGDDDQSIPVDDVEALRESVAKASVETEIVRYAGAGHGFHCDERSSYDQSSATDAWRRCLDWFGRFIQLAAGS